MLTLDIVFDSCLRITVLQLNKGTFTTIQFKTSILTFVKERTLASQRKVKQQ